MKRKPEVKDLIAIFLLISYAMCILGMAIYTILY